jgi:hypothetical protein
LNVLGAAVEAVVEQVRQQVLLQQVEVEAAGAAFNAN